MLEHEFILSRSPEDLDLLSGCFCASSTLFKLKSKSAVFSVSELSGQMLPAVEVTVFHSFPLLLNGIFSSLTSAAVCTLPVCCMRSEVLRRLTFFFIVFLCCWTTRSWSCKWCSAACTTLKKQQHMSLGIDWTVFWKFYWAQLKMPVASKLCYKYECIFEKITLLTC